MRKTEEIALGISRTERAAQLPEVPTIAEALPISLPSQPRTSPSPSPTRKTVSLSSSTMAPRPKASALLPSPPPGSPSSRMDRSHGASSLDSISSIVPGARSAHASSAFPASIAEAKSAFW